MTIGAHIPSAKINGLLHSSLILLAKKYPTNHFIFFVEKKIKLLVNNCTVVIISPKPKNKLLQHYWYNYKLPALLKRYDVNTFISTADMLSLKTTIDQYLLFEDDVFATEKKSNNYFKKIFSSNLKKARGIFVAEEIFKTNAISRLPDGEEKIKVVFHGIGDKKLPLGFTDQQSVKNQYTEGFEYFLYFVNSYTAVHLVIILKAFSLFKKWQKSSMKLVFILQNIKEEGLINDFKNYKYKNDIVFVTDKHNSAYILQTAYTTICFEKYAGNNKIFEAVQSGVPVIADETAINTAVFTNTVLFCEITAQSLSQKMMLLYKDEFERNRLIEAGYSKAIKYNSEAAAHKIWDTLTEV